MPIKVVSDGPVVTKRVVCPNCSYELEFSGEDVHTTHDSDGDRYQSIRCPRIECQSSTGGKHLNISVRWP